MEYAKDIISKLWNAIINYLYLLMLIGSTVYFICYLTYIFNAGPKFEFTTTFKVLSIVKDLAVIVFSAGIFTASLKFLAYIKVFETEFEKMFSKNNYGGKIADAIESITLSKEYFSKQSNINEIWKDLTLCMYQKQFPELHDKISDILKNDYYNNLLYYYKDEKVNFKFSSVSDDYIKIEQTVVYVLKRPNTDPFEWNFKLQHLNNEDFARSLNIEFLNCDFKYDPEKHLTQTIKGQNIIKSIDITLSGLTEYRIKRKIVEVQNFKIDRFWSFQNAKIVDNLHVAYEFTKDLNIIFTESHSSNIFKIDEDKPHSKSYLSNQIILPGEQFKLFFLKV